MKTPITLYISIPMIEKKQLTMKPVYEEYQKDVSITVRLP